MKAKNVKHRPKHSGNSLCGILRIFFLALIDSVDEPIATLLSVAMVSTLIILVGWF